jgi:hypothetical protein
VKRRLDEVAAAVEGKTGEWEAAAEELEKVKMASLSPPGPG